MTDGSPTPTAQRSRPAVAPQSILIHAINFAPEMIGCAKYTTELAQFLADRGHAVEVVTAPPHYPGWSVRAPYRALAYTVERMGSIVVRRCPILTRRNGQGVWRILAPLSFGLAAAPVVMWRILASRPDVVFCVEPTLFSAPAAAIAARIVGARTVLHVQDLEVDAAFAVGHVSGAGLRGAATRIERSLLGLFDQVVTISHTMRQRLLAKGLPARAVCVVRNWVDLAAIRPGERVNAYRRELGIGADRFVVLYSGNLGAKQGLHVLVEAAKALDPALGVDVVIAGEGPVKAALMASAAGFDHIRFLGLQPSERMSEFLATADLHALPQEAGAADLVLPSKLGGMLASGRPVAVTADPGTELHDLLEGAALITPAGDAAALAGSIRAARLGDLSGLVARGLALVSSMAARSVLPAFEARIVRSDPQLAAEGAAEAMLPASTPR